MEPELPNEPMIRDYLLGRLESDAALVERIDELMLNDPEFSESIDVIEDEILEEYLEGTLGRADNEAVESHFLRPPERQLKLRQASLLSRRISAPARDTRDEVPKQTSAEQFPLSGLRHWHPQYMTYVAIAAVALLSISSAYLMQSWRRLDAQLSQSNEMLVRERERSSGLSRQLDVVHGLAQPATVMLSLVQSGLSRGEAIVPELRIGSGTQKIHVEIAMPPIREHEYSVRLEAGGRIAWHLDSIRAFSSPDWSILMLDVPVQVLAEGENRFVVRQNSGSELTYFFATSKY